jgi:hypothetical protein
VAALGGKVAAGLAEEAVVTVGEARESAVKKAMLEAMED